MTTHVTMTTCVTVFPFPPNSSPAVPQDPLLAPTLLQTHSLGLATCRIFKDCHAVLEIPINFSILQEGWREFLHSEMAARWEKECSIPNIFTDSTIFHHLSKSISFSSKRHTKPGICGTEWYSSAIPVLLCYVGNATVYRYLVWPVFSWQNWCQYSTDNKGWQTTPGFFQKYHVYIFLQCMSQTL